MVIPGWAGVVTCPNAAAFCAMETITGVMYSEYTEEHVEIPSLVENSSSFPLGGVVGGVIGGLVVVIAMVTFHIYKMKVAGIHATPKILKNIYIK